ncbi:MAG: hypothetical protein VZQ51_06285 [Bacteroidales bacterium]|nr:hypothetical protein [Bacteroidales bacterium]
MTKKQIQNFLVAFTTDRMTEYMIEDYNVTLSDALKFIYNSETYAKLSQTENGLYSQSPAYVYELLEKEYLPHHNATEPNHHI